LRIWRTTYDLPRQSPNEWACNPLNYDRRTSRRGYPVAGRDPVGAAGHSGNLGLHRWYDGLEAQMNAKYMTNGALPGRDDLPPGCTLADIEREQRDDDEWWDEWQRKHGGTEPEDKLYE